MTTGLGLALLAVALSAVSGLPSALSRRDLRNGEALSAALAMAAGLCGLLAAVAALTQPTGWTEAAAFSLPWPIPGGAFTVALDPLSGWFLLPVSLLPAIAAGYGLGYSRPSTHGGRAVRLLQGLMTAGMLLLLLARNGLVFLLGWETMALSAFLLIGTEHHKAAARDAAWIYLVATHVGTFCLIACFALLPTQGGLLDWDPVAIASLPADRGLPVFLLALVGFGLKAGLMPLHVWLPAAHANAPSHVSAVLSGVMIKMGAYGVLRFATLLPPLPAGIGMALLLAGLASAVLGIACALRQGDLKRMLAYSSIENLGIVFLGIGLGLLGRATGELRWQVLGFAGALLHVLNHSLFKPALFFASGALIHAAGTRRMDQMGGLLRAMPRTALAFLLGSVAISGLPPGNGFASEMLLYLGLFDAAGSSTTPVVLTAVLGLCGLGMVGALAAAALIRAFGTVFLGAPRSAAATRAHEAPPSMTGSMLLLAFLCVGAGVAPGALAPWIDAVLTHGLGVTAARPGLLATAPLAAIGIGALVVLLALGALLAWLSRRRRRAASAGTWDCGYVAPDSPRIQYTASSFAAFLIGLQGGARRATKAATRGVLFPGSRSEVRQERELLLHRVLLPWFHRQAARCLRLRILQHGKVQIYLLYILIVLVLLLAWSSVRGGGR